MNALGIDKLNVILIVCSLIAALVLPFELFLFSYAFLGPIHYLTEINWLHQKNYFIQSNTKWMFVFVLFAAALILIPFIESLNLTNFNVLDYLKGSSKFWIIGFLFALSLLWFKNGLQLGLAFIVCFLLALVFKTFIPTGFYVLALFLPTVIHVYFFTLAFMLYGYLRHKTSYGFTAIVILVLVPFFIVLFPLKQLSYTISNDVMQVYSSSNFYKINTVIAKFFNIEDLNLTSVIGIKIQVFIAFAYTYHYLNWFSKTSIIGWKKDLSKQKIAAILLIWIGAVGLYLYDYKTGLIALLFLSMLHVFLEFPLNVISIKESYLLLKRKRNI